MLKGVAIFERFALADQFMKAAKAIRLPQQGDLMLALVQAENHVLELGGDVDFVVCKSP
jgi:hypothetical protein